MARARDAAVKFKLRFEILKILTRALRTVQGKINYKFNPYAILLKFFINIVRIMKNYLEILLLIDKKIFGFF